MQTHWIVEAFDIAEAGDFCLSLRREFPAREELALDRREESGGVRKIARQMGRSASTISRELRRNGATRSGGLEYRAVTGQWHAERAARRPKPAKLTANPALRTYVRDRLAGMVVTPSEAAVPGPVISWNVRKHGPRKDRRWASAWSPQQIANRLRLDFPDDETMRNSHEAIYQSLYVLSRGALRRALTACLRTGRADTAHAKGVQPRTGQVFHYAGDHD